MGSTQSNAIDRATNNIIAKREDDSYDPMEVRLGDGLWVLALPRGAAGAVDSLWFAGSARTGAPPSFVSGFTAQYAQLRAVRLLPLPLLRPSLASSGASTSRLDNGALFAIAWSEGASPSLLPPAGSVPVPGQGTAATPSVPILVDTFLVAMPDTASAKCVFSTTRDAGRASLFFFLADSHTSGTHRGGANGGPDKDNGEHSAAPPGSTPLRMNQLLQLYLLPPANSPAVPSRAPLRVGVDSNSGFFVCSGADDNSGVRHVRFVLYPQSTAFYACKRTTVSQAPKPKGSTRRGCVVYSLLRDVYGAVGQPVVFESADCRQLHCSSGWWWALLGAGIALFLFLVLFIVFAVSSMRRKPPQQQLEASPIKESLGRTNERSNSTGRVRGFSLEPAGSRTAQLSEGS